MLALKPEGPKPQLSSFFKQAAQGFYFLSMWFAVSKSDQEELLSLLQKAYAKSLKTAD